MGKTIEKAIEWYEGLECYTPQAKNARDIAIDTMRKYQKIEQILDDCDLEAWKVLENIKEVVKDGKIDCN